MKRERSTVLFLGVLAAVGSLLFPCWEWENVSFDQVISESRRAFFGSPPKPSAHIDWEASLFPLEMICLMMAGALALWQTRKRDTEVGAFWKAKWESTSDKESTLLRAASEPAVPVQTLLRAAAGSPTTQADQMLRASQKSDPLENTTDTRPAAPVQSIIGEPSAASSEVSVLRRRG